MRYFFNTEWALRMARKLNVILDGYRYYVDIPLSNFRSIKWWGILSYVSFFVIISVRGNIISKDDSFPMVIAIVGMLVCWLILPVTNYIYGSTVKLYSVCRRHRHKTLIEINDELDELVACFNTDFWVRLDVDHSGPQLYKILADIQHFSFLFGKYSLIDFALLYVDVELNNTIIKGNEGDGRYISGSDEDNEHIKMLAGDAIGSYIVPLRPAKKAHYEEMLKKINIELYADVTSYYE